MDQQESNKIIVEINPNYHKVIFNYNLKENEIKVNNNKIVDNFGDILTYKKGKYLE